MYVLQQLINGISQGSIYALMAIGYTLIVGVVGLVTFAYGEMVMIGAMSAYLFYVFVVPNFFLGLLVAFIAAGLAGIFIHKVAYERFLTAPSYISLLCTVGCSILIKNIAQIAFGSQVNAVPKTFKVSSVTFFDGQVYITTLHMMVIGIVIVLAVGLTLFLNKTRLGLKLRAVSQDKKAARLCGINVKGITLLGNIVGTGLGGVAGLLFATYLTNVSTIFGTVVGLKAISACVLGGMTNIPGAAIGAMLIGILENFGIAVFSSSYRDVFAFAFVLIALSVRPQGLLVRSGGNLMRSGKKVSGK